jgi:hypothetical protein
VAHRGKSTSFAPGIWGTSPTTAEGRVAVLLLLTQGRPFRLLTRDEKATWLSVSVALRFGLAWKCSCQNQHTTTVSGGGRRGESTYSA